MRIINSNQDAEVIVTAENITAASNEQYQRIADGKEQIIELLRRQGFRITKQRRQILDVIFDYECASCKEIYYRAIQKDSKIGMATVYRMVNTLTDICVLKVTSFKPQTRSGAGNGCEITTIRHGVVELTEMEWKSLLSAALQKKGINPAEEITKVVIK